MLIFLLQIWALAVYAQADDPGMPGGDPDVPLDGGAIVLLLAGAAYGAKKINEAGKNKKEH